MTPTRKIRIFSSPPPPSFLGKVEIAVNTISSLVREQNVFAATTLPERSINPRWRLSERVFEAFETRRIRAKEMARKNPGHFVEKLISQFRRGEGALPPCVGVFAGAVTAGLGAPSGVTRTSLYSTPETVTDAPETSFAIAAYIAKM